MLHEIEQGESDDAEIGHLVTDAVVRRIWRPCGGSTSSTMCCLAKAKSCTCSSGTAFEQLKERKAIYLETKARTRAAG